MITSIYVWIDNVIIFFKGWSISICSILNINNNRKIIITKIISLNIFVSVIYWRIYHFRWRFLKKKWISWIYIYQNRCTKGENCISFVSYIRVCLCKVSYFSIKIYGRNTNGSRNQNTAVDVTVYWLREYFNNTDFTKPLIGISIFEQ